MPFPFILVGLMIAGAAASAAAANQANQRAKGAAGQNYLANNQDLYQSMLASYDQSSRLGVSAASNIGQLLNRTGGARGQSSLDTVGQVALDAGMDAQNIRQGQDYAKSATAIRQQQVQNQANSSLQPIGMAAIQGGIQGASIGSSLQGAFDSYQRSTAQAAALQKAQLAMDPQNSPAIQEIGRAQASALADGVSPQYLNHPAVMERYQQQQIALAYNVKSAENNYNASLNNLWFSGTQVQRANSRWNMQLPNWMKK